MKLVELSKVEVKFDELSVEAECEVIHGKSIPTLWNTIKGMLCAEYRKTMFKDWLKMNTIAEGSPKPYTMIVEDGLVTYRRRRDDKILPFNETTTVGQLLERNQKTLRADLSNNVCAVIGRGDHDAKNVGRRVILPSSYTGGPRYVAQNYMDAMAICRWFGNMDLFITMMANPKWDETQECLHRYENSTTDLECPVFKVRLDGMLAHLSEGVFFGQAKAIVNTIDFQKRGLPNAHILVCLEPVLRNPTHRDTDESISAELLENGICTTGFPKPYTDKDGFVTYQRRQDDGDFVSKGTTKLGNSFVAPHNLLLLKKYKAHTNVEWWCQTEAIKYLFKYVNKGVHSPTIVVEKSNDSTKETGTGKEDSKEVGTITQT